jgi:hypothetical protein
LTKGAAAVRGEGICCLRANAWWLFTALISQ